MNFLSYGRLRSRNGFTQNACNVWGHCEHPVCYWSKEGCLNRTLYRCDQCKQFICADHQKAHLLADHEPESDVKRP